MHYNYLCTVESATSVYICTSAVTKKQAFQGHRVHNVLEKEAIYSREEGMQLSVYCSNITAFLQHHLEDTSYLEVIPSLVDSAQVASIISYRSLQLHPHSRGGVTFPITEGNFCQPIEQKKL